MVKWPGQLLTQSALLWQFQWIYTLLWFFFALVLNFIFLCISQKDYQTLPYPQKQRKIKLEPGIKLNRNIYRSESFAKSYLLVLHNFPHSFFIIKKTICLRSNRNKNQKCSLCFLFFLSFTFPFDFLLWSDFKVCWNQQNSHIGLTLVKWLLQLRLVGWDLAMWNSMAYLYLYLYHFLSYVQTILESFSWQSCSVLYEHLSNKKSMWLSPLKISAAQLRSVTEIAPKSPFLYVNRSLVRYGFRACAKAIWYIVNIALAGLGIALFIFFVVGIHVWKQSQYGHHKMGKWNMSESGSWLLQSMGAVRETLQSKLETRWGKESKLALRT